MDFLKESLLAMIQVVWSVLEILARLDMLVQCLSQKGISSWVVILGGTAIKMVILGKVIAREKSSAWLLYLFCFGKSAFI